MVLTSRTLICRYHNAYNNSNRPKTKERHDASTTEFVKEWQLNIKVAVERHKKNKRGGHTFKARNIAETRIFEGCNNSKADSIMLAYQEPILEVVLMAKELGYW